MVESDNKRHRISFGRILGTSKKDKEPKLVRNSSEAQQSGGSSNFADSTYASSDNERVPMENTGQFSGVSGDKNLSVNKGTGDVVDNETGEVVSTVTTTTTTTTTTTMRSGKNGKKEVVEVTTQPGSPAKQSVQEMPGDGPSQTQHYSSPNSDTTTNVSHLGPQTQTSVPNVPSRSPNRPSRENMENAVSPVDNSQRHNFSYPSRNNLRDSWNVQQQQGGTFDNLKAAAKGIHGVGETLRGTLNSEVDQRMPRRDADKAAAVDAKNQATLEAGQREMAGLRERSGLDATVSPDTAKDLPDLPEKPSWTYHPNAPKSPQPPMAMDNKGRRYTPPTGTDVQSDDYYGGPSGQQSYETMNASSTSSGERRGLRKLIKRRPVNS